MAVKKLGKELGNDDHHIISEPRGEFYFIMITKVFTRSVTIKYVVCLPIKVVLNLTEFLSLTV